MDDTQTPVSDVVSLGRVILYDLCTGRMKGGHQEDYLIAMEHALAPLGPETVAPFRFGRAAALGSLPARLLRCSLDFLGWLHGPQPVCIIAPNASATEFFGLFLAECLPGRNRGSRIVFVMRREADGITAGGWRADLLDRCIRSLARRRRIDLVSDTPQAAAFWSRRTGRPCALVTIPIRRPRRPPAADRAATLGLMGAFRIEKGARVYDSVVEAALALDPAVRVEMQIGLQGDNSVEAQLAHGLRTRWGENPRVAIHDHLSGEAYTDLLYRSDIVVLPYHVESYGLGSSGVMFEAIAAGRMVVAAPIRWAVAEFADHPGVIWLENAEADSLREAVALALERLPEWRRRSPPPISDDAFARSWFDALSVPPKAIPPNVMSAQSAPSPPPAMSLPPGAIVPNLFIVGAMKSYTTSLFEAFRASPDVYCSPIKEPNFFCSDLHNHPTFWLAKDSVINPARYARLFHSDAPERRYRLEASTNYLPSTAAAANIRAASPDARIIIMLRNPIERAWSEYKMNCARGDEILPFPKAVKAEADHARMQRPYLLRRYITGGLYADQVARYLEIFPRDQVLVEVVDRPGRSAPEVFARAFAFLGIDPPPVGAVHENSQIAAVFPRLNSLAYYSGIKILASRITPERIKAAAKRWMYRPDASRISDDDRRAVRAYFTEDIARLEAMLGESFDHWT